MTKEQDEETYRYQCEIRSIIQIGIKDGRKGVERFIGLVAKYRGQSVADGINADVYLQRSRGNNGTKDEWKDA